MSRRRSWVGAGQVLARNALLAEVLGSPLDPGSSFFCYQFLDPLARRRIINWADFAAASVGAMRLEAGRYPHDRQLTALIDELRASDADVGRWWDDLGVRDSTSVAKRIAHPTAGLLSFAIETVVAPHEPDQRLVVYTVEAGSSTSQALAILASGLGSAARNAQSLQPVARDSR